MPTFAYHAIDQGGKTIDGLLDAENEDSVANMLNKQGFIPVRVHHASAAATKPFVQRLQHLLRPVPPRDLILFTKQFSTMTHAGIPILSMLDILESQTENKHLRNVVVEMKCDVENGIALNKAFRKHRDVFSNLYITMVEAGEASGALPEVLDRLTYIIRHEHKVRADVKAAVRYPLFVLGFLFVGFIVLQLFVVPRFATLFRRAGIDLPLPTQICVTVYDGLVAYWLPGLALVAAAVVGLVAFLRTEQGSYCLHTGLLRVPLIGPLLLKTVMSRFASIFAILQASGVPVLDSIDILSKTIGNRAIMREFSSLQSQLREGKGIAQPLRSAAYFTPMVVNMIAIGEETGNLDEMLREVAQHYDLEVEYGTQKLSDAIGPILTILLAVLVGFFALAIYLPMWDMAKLIK